ncbi:hypothetical protein COY33_00090 [candidate division WWE3 bacterium CG_4_10_14_0_2_um_filter_42_7]|uniref:Uncharacterized protein n=2 Tax=Katanobacteria TaxID=422282 RepID=A0A2H0X8Z4_UNCKA|nr:MAG: hypothetical protein COT51_03095 [candidate division WWE3 bacterium CG08_land_8_20_14_0_20_41_15]PIZ44222.1 MAG: hypothetical protein COY33_00090 [candidate division WWE3 bacterium CG_4_10_14_0_2_um_filter_42_7]
MKKIILAIVPLIIFLIAGILSIFGIKGLRNEQVAVEESVQEEKKLAPEYVVQEATSPASATDSAFIN